MALWSKTYNKMAVMPSLCPYELCQNFETTYQNQMFYEPGFWYVALWMLALQFMVD